MKRTVFALAFTILLSACGSSVVTYDLEISIDDPARVPVLQLAAERVIERRLQSIGEDVVGLNLLDRTTAPAIQVEVSAPVVAETLTEMLTEEFDLSIMRQTDEGEVPDKEVEGHGGFMHTGLTQDHIIWMTASADDFNNTASITIEFTEQGRTMMKEIFEQNEGEFIAIFVRDAMLAKLLVDTDQLLDQIVIQGIPSPDLAQVVTDDVNVGTHVTFIPR